VITGFRHAIGGFQSIVHVTPDLSTVGKAMANGYPIGAIGGRADLIDQFSTTPGNPVFFAGNVQRASGCAAAALATISKLEREPVHEHIFALGDRIRRELTSSTRDWECRRSCRDTDPSSSRTSSRAGDVVRRPPRERRRALTGYRRALLDAGIFELPLNLKRSHVSYAHEDRHVGELVEATEAAVRSVLDQRS